jgi:hypothetical protein
MMTVTVPRRRTDGARHIPALGDAAVAAGPTRRATNRMWASLVGAPSPSQQCAERVRAQQAASGSALRDRGYRRGEPSQPKRRTCPRAAGAILSSPAPGHLHFREVRVFRGVKYRWCYDCARCVRNTACDSRHACARPVLSTAWMGTCSAEGSLTFSVIHRRVSYKNYSHHRSTGECRRNVAVCALETLSNSGADVGIRIHVCALLRRVVPSPHARTTSAHHTRAPHARTTRAFDLENVY